MTTPPAASNSPGAGPDSPSQRIIHRRSEIRRPGVRAEAAPENDIPAHTSGAIQRRPWRPWPRIQLLQALHGGTPQGRRNAAAHRSPARSAQSSPETESALSESALSEPAQPQSAFSEPPQLDAPAGSGQGVETAAAQRVRQHRPLLSQPKPAAKLPPRPEHPPVPVPEPRRRIPDRRPRRRAPLAVNAAALLIAAAGVLVLVVGVRAALDPGRPFPEAAVQLQELKVPPETVLAVARVADIAVAFVMFGLYVFLATLIREGRNWARGCCGLLIAAALFFGIRDNLSQHVGAALLAGTGLALLFLPHVNRYFSRRGAGAGRR